MYFSCSCVPRERVREQREPQLGLCPNLTIEVSSGDEGPANMVPSLETTVELSKVAENHADSQPELASYWEHISAEAESFNAVEEGNDYLITCHPKNQKFNMSDQREVVKRQLQNQSMTEFAFRWWQ